MKKVTLLLAALFLSFTTNVFSQIGDQTNQERDLRVSLFAGFDVPNATIGGRELNTGERRNTKSLSVKFGVRTTINYFEIGVNVNLFPTIHYKAIGISLHKEILTLNLSNNNSSKFATLIGCEWNLVSREGLDVEGTVWKGLYDEVEGTFHNFALSLILRYDNPFDLPIFVEGNFDMMYRADIVYAWGRDALPSGTLPAMWYGRSVHLNFGFYLK